MDKQTLIIVVAAASVVGAILGIIGIRLLVKSCRSESIPIPPPQQLRHHAQAASRPQTVVYGSDFTAPILPFGSSRTSLVSFPRHGGTAESGSDLSLNTSPMDTLGDPQPSFTLVSPSSVSLQSDEVSSSLSHETSTASHRRMSSKQRARSRSQGRSPSVASSLHRQSRPVSLASTYSRSTLSGTPHGPFSSVQIILPTPLAGGASYSEGMPRDRRMSYVDSWAPVPVRTETPMSAAHLSHADPRSSTSSTSSGGHQLKVMPRRTSSSSSSPSTSPLPSPLATSYTVDSESAPPVPRIPSMYNNYPPETQVAVRPQPGPVQGRGHPQESHIPPPFVLTKQLDSLHDT